MTTKLRTPVMPSTGASGQVHTLCVVLGIDNEHKKAHVQTSLTKNLEVSLTRLPGKGSLPPVAGETWMITQMFGGWTFMFQVNPSPTAGPTASRPLTPVVGQPYFDTTINRPIWYGNTGWINASGVAV